MILSNDMQREYEKEINIAKKYGVKQATISAIKTSKTWSHI